VYRIFSLCDCTCRRLRRGIRHRCELLADCAGPRTCLRCLCLKYLLALSSSIEYPASHPSASSTTLPRPLHLHQQRKMADSTPKSYHTDPTLYLYTSLTSGSSHIITATSRLETILKANRIQFQALDVATDEKARMLWGRRAGKRKLPGLVRMGMIVAVGLSGGREGVELFGA